MQEMKWRPSRALIVVGMFLALALSVIVIGSMDCAPIDDSDLLLSERETPYSSEGNGWTVLSDTLHKAENLREDDHNWLMWYADPTNFEFYACHDPDFLSNFTNKQQMCAYVREHLHSNKWIFAGLDAAVSAPRFVPPPPHLSADIQLDLSTGIFLTRSFLPAELRSEIESGNFNAAICSLRRILRLATLLQTQRGGLTEYTMSHLMLYIAMDSLEQVVADNALTAEELTAIEQEFNNLPGLSTEAFTHALKCQYAREKECLHRIREAEHQFFEEPFLNMIPRPFLRYLYHENRTLRTIAAETRRCLSCIEQGVAPEDEVNQSDGHWYDVLIPNWIGRIEYPRSESSWQDIYPRITRGAMELPGRVQAFRDRLRERAQGNVHTSPSEGYFPLSFTNGCFYTSNLKKILAVGPKTESVVVGGEVEIDYDADFSNIKHIVIAPNCTNCLDRWIDVFKQPEHLESISGDTDYLEAVLEKGFLNWRRTRYIMTILENQERELEREETPSRTDLTREEIEQIREEQRKQLLQIQEELKASRLERERRSRELP